MPGNNQSQGLAGIERHHHLPYRNDHQNHPYRRKTHLGARAVHRIFVGLGIPYLSTARGLDLRIAGCVRWGSRISQLWRRIPSP